MAHPMPHDLYPGFPESCRKAFYLMESFARAFDLAFDKDERLTELDRSLWDVKIDVGSVVKYYYTEFIFKSRVDNRFVGSLYLDSFNGDGNWTISIGLADFLAKQESREIKTLIAIDPSDVVDTHHAARNLHYAIGILEDYVPIALTTNELKG